MIKECKICKKEFESKRSRQLCCSPECTILNDKIRRKNYDNSPARKEAHRLWRLSERGKKWMQLYNKSEHANSLRKIRNKTEKYKAFQHKYDWQSKRVLARKIYRTTKKGREAFRMMCRRREARLNNVVHKFTTDEWLNKLYTTKGICPCCNKYIGIDKLTMDHIYALYWANRDYLKTGIKRVYTINDVQPMCLRCNVIKSNRLILPEVK